MKRLCGLLLALLVVTAGCGNPAEDAGGARVERVLIVSLPGVGWQDVQEYDLPNLQRFVGEAAIGDLSTRIGRSDAQPTDAYLTISAGTRAAAPDIDRAVALDPDETYGGVPASDILLRRRGAVPAGIFYLGVGAARDDNSSSLYGAKVGTLGDQLAAAGIERAVIGNADAAEGFISNEPPPEGAYARSAATALMGSNGIVPHGTVGRSLLTDDPNAPFGRRLEQAAVMSSFDDVWEENEPTVALVEASDLSRADAYDPRASAEQAERLREDALTDADELLGELLERVDPETDAVLALSPVAPAGQPALGIAALQAPGVHGGVLESATTRRSGYVQLADVAPTVMSLVGIDRPERLEGRSFQVASAGSGNRIDRLVDAADAAGVRDDILPGVVVAFIAFIGVLCVGTYWRELLPGWLRRALAPAALSVLGAVPATFVVGKLGIARSGLWGYLLCVALVGAVVGLLSMLIDRRWPGFGVLAALGTTVGLVAADVAFGAPLQLNTVFGYSVGVAGRFSGIGNLAFALFGSATLLLATLIAERRGLPTDRSGPGFGHVSAQSQGQNEPGQGGEGWKWALGLLAVVVLIEGLPMLGADVGGVVSMVPAFGLAVLVLAGRRIRFSHVIGLAITSGVVLLGFAFIDAARSQQSQTHLARLAQHVLDGRWSMFFGTLGRRWQASLGGAELAGWITLAVVVVGAALYIVAVGRGIIGPGHGPDWSPAMKAAGAGLAVLGGVGLIANDSSFAVPATMLITVVPVMLLRALGPSGLERETPTPVGGTQ